MQRSELSDRQTQSVEFALQLLATHGARRFTVASLAAEFGVTRSAAHRHFVSMEAVFDAVIGRVEHILFERFPPESTDPLERRDCVFFDRARSSAAHPRISHLLLSHQPAKASHPAQAARMAGFKRRSRDSVIACLREARRTGAMAQELNPEAGAVLVLGSILTLSHATSPIPRVARAGRLTEQVSAMVQGALQLTNPAETSKSRPMRKRRGGGNAEKLPSSSQPTRF